MNILVTKYLLPVFFYVSSCILVVGQSLELEKVQQVFDQPLTIKNKNGGVFTGYVQSIEREKLTLKTKAGKGEVIYSFARGDITNVIFPGTELKLLVLELLEDNFYQQALPLMEALYEQQTPFFSFLKEPELFFFFKLAHVYLKTNALQKAITTANQLIPQIQDKQRLEQLNEIILLAYFKLQSYDQARSLAQMWVKKAKPFQQNALGWWILAYIAFEKKQYNEALWTSLQPIVFSGQLPMSYLGHCYSVAVASAHSLKMEGKATQLYTEMQQRHLKWPDIPNLNSFKTLYSDVPDNQKKSKLTETVQQRSKTPEQNAPAKESLLKTIRKTQISHSE
jgi:hypothetical protein